MPVTIRSALKALLLSQGQAGEGEDKSEVKEVSGRSLDLFQEKLEELARFVAREAMRGNYYRLAPIDIQRGLDKWHEERIAGKLRLAVG